jgi:hypothetical protein
MKTICRLISVVLISMFVFSLTSCSDHEEIVPEKKQSSIVVKVLKSSVKYGEDDDEHIIILPKVEGSVSNSEGAAISHAKLEIISLPDHLLKVETTSDSNGKFTFYNVKRANYELIVSSGGNIIKKDYIKL